MPESMRGPIEKQINADQPLDDVQWELVRADIAAAKAAAAMDRRKLFLEQLAMYGHNVHVNNREMYERNGYSSKDIEHIIGPDPRIKNGK